jgi:hypothetical protein
MRARFMPARTSLVLTVVTLSSACVFSSEGRPTVDVNLQAASEYVFRGQVMTERPVLQAETLVQAPTADGGTASVAAWGNLDLTDHVGEAWFDPGHGGEFTQTDFQAAYGRSFGEVDASLGIRYYGWPNNETFPFAPFPSTSELFLRVGSDLDGFRPAVIAHYDIDEVESLYVLAEVMRDVPFSKTVRLELRAALGWSDDRHSAWLYRTPGSAFSDLGASVVLVVDLDEITRLRVGAHGSTIVDDDLRSWFEANSDADTVWFTAGVGWAW